MRGAPEETGASFRENAVAKALYGATIAPAESWVLGEDSGIEVDALAGRPGIHSARFAGPDASDEDNNRRLLAELDGCVARSARYVCELVARDQHGGLHHGRGTLEGAVAPAPSGSGGFGYDPLFVPAGETQTVGELGNAWKRAASHRASAAADLLRALAATRG